MRILLCTKNDLAGCLILNRMLPRLGGDTVKVLLSDKTRPSEATVPELAEMKFLERDLPVGTLFPMIDRLTMAGGPLGRLATFQGCARRHGVPVQVVGAINDAKGEALVRDFAPDLIVSVRFSLIFKPNIFSLPRLGTYNVHPGALPRYAGLFAPFRSLVDGQDRIGCTLHRVDEGIDTGPVVGIGWLPVQPARSLLWHVLGTYEPGLDLFFQMLDTLRHGGTVIHQPQDASQRHYVSLPEAKSFQTLHARGHRLFDADDYQTLLNDFMPQAAAEHQEGASCCCARA